MKNAMPYIFTPKDNWTPIAEWLCGKNTVKPDSAKTIKALEEFLNYSRTENCMVNEELLKVLRKHW